MPLALVIFWIAVVALIAWLSEDRMKMVLLCLWGSLIVGAILDVLFGALSR